MPTVKRRYHLLLRRPDLLLARLGRLHAEGRVQGVPTLWQVLLGVAYMQYRVAFRPETIGVTDGVPVRSTLRARLLAHRPVRFPFLAAARVIHLTDLVGIGAPAPFLRRHLLGAYHPGDNAMYDLEVLSADPGELERLRDELVEVLSERTPKGRFLKDLVVYEGYHERLLGLIDRAIAGDFAIDADAGPASDASLSGFVAWCLAQPATPAETVEALRSGRLRFDPRAAA